MKGAAPVPHGPCGFSYKHQACVWPAGRPAGCPAARCVSWAGGPVPLQAAHGVLGVPSSPVLLHLMECHMCLSWSTVFSPKVTPAQARWGQAHVSDCHLQTWLVGL